MIPTKRVKKKVPTIRKYDDGYFVDDSKPSAFNQYFSDADNLNSSTGGQKRSAIASGANTISGIIGATQNPRQANVGTSTLQGALSGAAEGYKDFGIIGGGVGLIAGAATSYFGAKNKQKQIDQQNQSFDANQLSQVQSSLHTSNINPYGTQMYELGDVISPPDTSKRNYNFHYNAPLSPTNPLMVEKLDGSTGQWGNDLNTKYPLPNFNTSKPVIQPAVRDSWNNSMQRGVNLPNSITPNAIHSNYAFGGPVRNPAVTGKFKIPNSGFNHFAPHLTRHEKINSPINGKVDFNNSGASNQPSNQPNLEAHPQQPFQTPSFAYGDEVYGMNQDGNTTDFNGNENNAQKRNPQDFNGTPVNTQQNKINIQKGELLIDPSSGKVIQNYNGINPLTGGLYEPHAKSEQDESENNFTLADPGLFVITKKTAPQYKEAIDNNDKISQKTVLMNIRNAKIQKEGGLKPRNYADGDTVDPNQGLQYVNVPQWNPNISTPQNYTNPYFPNQNRGPNLQDPKSTGFLTDSPSSTPNINPTQINKNVNTPLAAKPNNTFGNIVNGLQKDGPGLVNIAQGLFGQTQTQPYAHPAVNPYLSQIQANMPKDVDMGPVISDIRSTQNLENTNLANNTNNSAVVRANRQQIGSNTNKNLVNARMQGQEMNNQSAGQRAYMYNALGYQNVQDQQQQRQYNLNVDDINARRTAAKQNLFNAGLSQLQQVGMNDQRNKQQQDNDDLSRQLISQIFPDTKYYSNLFANYKKQ